LWVVVLLAAVAGCFELLDFRYKKNRTASRAVFLSGFTLSWCDYFLG
jgi:hypothetical protein